MIVDLEKKEQTGSFELAGGGKVHLRLLTTQDIKEMQAACIKKETEYPKIDGAYQRFVAEQFDGEKFLEMRFDRNIVGWDGIFDKNKKPVPVTKENKFLLMTLSPSFAKAVDDGLAALKKAERERVEETEKNSLNSQSGRQESGA